MATKIAINHVGKDYIGAEGERTPVLSDINLRVAENEFVCLVGKSGCGKTTLLNMIAGFVAPTRGSVLVDGRPVTGPGGGKGVVFQQFALFPWLTAAKNIEFGCVQTRMSEGRRKAVVSELIELVNLGGFEDKYPFQLSGGMQQRVAIARALAVEPHILLMDEPFGALDEITRFGMQSEILRIWSTKRTTVIFVTHSVSEALALADRVVVMGSHPGTIRAQHEITLPRPRKRGALIALEEEIQNALG